jgi:hypothetical protein
VTRRFAMKRYSLPIALGLAIMLAAALGGCAPDEQASVTSAPEETMAPEPAPGAGAESADEPAEATEPAPEPPSTYAWLDTELTDAATGETFAISDFRGRPVLLHAFAVW